MKTPQEAYGIYGTIFLVEDQGLGHSDPFAPTQDIDHLEHMDHFAGTQKLGLGLARVE